jgi:hypothetical protein
MGEIVTGLYYNEKANKIHKNIKYIVFGTVSDGEM